MDSLLFKGKLAGLLMTGGAFILMQMIADLLYKGALIGADSVSAGLHNREKTDPRILLQPGNGSVSGGWNGAGFPLLASLFLAGTASVLIPGRRAVLSSTVVFLWGIDAACFLNVRYCMTYCAHGSLLLRKFHAEYVSLINTHKALIEACAALPAGVLRANCSACLRNLGKGYRWGDALGVFDNGLFVGKGLKIILGLYENHGSTGNENAPGAFSDFLDRYAVEIRDRITELRRPLTALIVVNLVYSLSIICRLLSGSSALPVTALMIMCVMQIGAALCIRNVCVRGRLLW